MSDMFTDPNTLPIVAKAARTNSERDKQDESFGFAKPSNTGVDGYLRTAMCAIHTGLSSNDFDCVAEGYAMLQDIHSILMVKKGVQ